MNDFRRKVLKVDGPRKHTIKKSMGVYDFYKQIRNEGYPGIGQKITEHQFYRITRVLNQCLANSLAEGKTIKLPQGMGKLEIRKKPAVLKYKDNKLINNLSVDWDSTLKLWAENPQCMESKTLVRFNNPEFFLIKYNKYRADFNNVTFYKFQPNRDIKINLKRLIRKGLIDAHLLYE
jgi:hypothetical protein